ncbi:MAG TPA: Rrf2 family transcriptional regulator [Ignavibacteria bacterium]|nr:Rrf2 family transcriptional regulator [Ignavibacteria bacterium]
MTVLFSRQCEYGIQAVLYIAAKGKDAVVSSQEISEVLGIPREFVSKTLQLLCKCGITASIRGNSGGFYIKKNSGKIHLLDIVKAIDGKDILESCVLGFPECSSSNPCPMHKKWKKLRENISDILSTESIDMLKVQMAKKIK